MSAKRRTRTAGKAIDKSAQTSAGGRVALSDRPLRFEFLVAVLAMIVAISVLYPELIFHNDVFYAVDNQAAASFASVGRASLDKGIYPVWNPYVFAGMPSFASLQYTPYVYPVTPVLGMLRRYLFFPMSTWLLFHTLLMGVGTYLLLRTRRVHYLASIAAGILMMWMPNLVAVGANGHGTQACASGYLPFALLLWDRVWRGRGTLANGAALLIVLGLSMLRAHLQISYYTYALVALYMGFFGVLRIIDGFRGRRPDSSMLPKRWLLRLTRGGERYTPGAATAEVAWGVAVLAVIVAGSLMMGAVLQLPVHDYAQYSIRGSSVGGGTDYNYATSWSLHPLESLTFLFPYAYGFGKDLYFGHMPFTYYPNYLGFVVLAFALAAVILVRQRYIRFLAFIAMVATVVSFGKFFPILYAPLFKFAPFFNKFRVPVMALIVQQLAVVVLFGVGLDAVMRLDRSRGRLLSVKALIAGTAFLLVALVSDGYWSGGFAQAIAPKISMAQNAQQQLALSQEAGAMLGADLVRFAVMFILAAGLLFLYFTNRGANPQVFVAGILVIAVVDFYLVDRNILHPERFRSYEGFRIIQNESVLERHGDPDDVIRFLEEQEPYFRVFPMESPQQPFSGMFRDNRYMNFGISSIGGYHAAKLAVYQEFFQSLAASLSVGTLQLLDILNVRYIISGVPLPEHPRVRAVWQGSDAEGLPRFIYENMGALPRVYFVDRYRVENKERTLALLAEGTVDVRNLVILREEPAAPLGSREGAEGHITRYDFNEIAIESRAAEPCLMVLSEVYYPDWKATIDGNPVRVLRANHILRAIELPAGEHEVVFRYDTTLLKRGAAISVSTFALAIVTLIGSLIVSRSRKRGSADLHTDVQRA